MRKHYHAYTALTSPLPSYISVNGEEDGTVSVTVRTQGSDTASTIYLTPEQAEQLATDIIAKLNEGA